jgi:hypothetical protein
MAGFVGVAACPPGAFVACQAIHRSPVPRGRAAPPGQAFTGGQHQWPRRASPSPATSPATPSCTTAPVAPPGRRSWWRCRIVSVMGSSGGMVSRRSSPWWSGATRPCTPPSRWRRAAGWWSWAGWRSARGRPTTAAPGRWSRWWPTSWGRASGGQPPCQPGQQGRTEPQGMPGRQREFRSGHKDVPNVTGRVCRRSPMDPFTGPDASATIEQSRVIRCLPSGRVEGLRSSTRRCTGLVRHRRRREEQSDEGDRHRCDHRWDRGCPAGTQLAVAS